jgi:hypothetical protein
MKFSFSPIHAGIGLILLAAAAPASPIVWTLNNVVLSDGSTATGSFTFDADAGTPCAAFSPCGKYSNVDIVTTTGPSRAGVTYSFVCGQDVTACTGVTSDSTEVLFLASNAANQAGNPAIAFFFTGVGMFPPQGLTDAGGSIDISGGSPAVGIVNEAACSSASCTAPSNPSRASVAGVVSAVPEPATWFLLAGGLLAMCPLRRVRRLSKQRLTRCH